jgi:hypothetical protein
MTTLIQFLFGEHNAMMAIAFLAALPAIAGAASSLFGAASAGAQRRRMDADLKARQAKNDAWYNNEANSDYLQRADSQAAVQQARETLRKQNEAAANTAAVTGATPEEVAASRSRSNEAMGTLYGNLAAQGAVHRDQVRSQYLQQDNALTNALSNNQNNSASSGETMMQNGIKAVANTNWAGILGKTPAIKTA